MSALKKQKTAAAATPNKTRFFENLDAVLEARGGVGQMLIVGIGGDDEEDEEEEEDLGKDYTEEQLATLRYIIITNKRAKLIEKAYDFTDPNGGWFNTNSGNIVIAGIPAQITKALKPKDIPSRFDGLFALTTALDTNDYWLHDNECYGEDGTLDKAIIKLGKAWKALLKHTSDELGIDPEYTRPGIESLLSKFEEKVGETDCIEVDFKWK